MISYIALTLILMVVSFLGGQAYADLKKKPAPVLQPIPSPEPIWKSSALVKPGVRFLNEEHEESIKKQAEKQP